MERQLKLRKTLLEIGHHPSRLGLVLKAHHKVVAVAHDDHSSLCVAFPPLMDPEVESVMHLREVEFYLTSPNGLTLRN